MSKVSKMQSVQRLKRRRPGARPTSEQKADYLNLIRSGYVDGLSTSEIAEKIGVSAASIYRWWRQQDQIQHKLNTEAIEGLYQIDQAVHILCQASSSEPRIVRDALFQFLTWIRWPDEPEYYLAALINCTASYLKQKQCYNNIDDIDRQDASLLFRYLTLSTIIRFSSPQSALNPDFEVVSDKASRYDDRQFFAEIVNYLISDKIIIAGKQHRPNLQKLQYLVHEGAFGKNWTMSPRTFEKYWRTRAASFPYLYVEQYHSHFDWSLNPQDQDFAQSVDEILHMAGSLPEYFGRVKWVTERLTCVLDPRAVRLIAFPTLPKWIDPLPVENPQPSSKLQAKIGGLF
ncbi:transposase [Methylobacterium sp. A54F]